MPAPRMHDVCIIGAGPAGLAVLSALHSKRGTLDEKQITRERLHMKLTGAGGGASCTYPCLCSSTHRAVCMEKGGLDLIDLWSFWSLARPGTRSGGLSVCVVDPSDSWLSQWNGRFEALGIDRLRSPAFATPHSFTDEAIMEYAFKMGRTAELYEPEITEKNSAKNLTHRINAGFFRLAGTQLFADFCEDHAASLPHVHVRGQARDVEKAGDGNYCISVDQGQGQQSPTVHARRVVFALGAATVPNVPRIFLSQGIMNQPCEVPAKDQIPRIVHTNSWKVLNALSFTNEVVVVIGGGLSAAQAALLAARRGAKQVVLVSRRPMEPRMFDLPFAWMNPQAGWRASKAGKNGSRKETKKFRTFEFFQTPVEDRLAWIKSARGGATVPIEYLNDLAKGEKTGRIQRRVDDVAAVEMGACQEGHCGTVRVSFLHGTAPITADRILLATGSVLDAAKVPLLRNVVDRFNVPLMNGLPDVNTDMQWGGEDFVVAGAMAMLQVGPDAGNLTGCRRCAERIANAVGVFDSFDETGGPLHNDFAALHGNPDHDHSGDDSSDDDDIEEKRDSGRAKNNPFAALALDGEDSDDSD